MKEASPQADGKQTIINDIAKYEGRDGLETTFTS